MANVSTLPKVIVVIEGIIFFLYYIIYILYDILLIDYLVNQFANYKLSPMTYLGHEA